MKERLEIPYLLRDNAILQRNIGQLFWGYTAPQKEVKLTFEDFSETTISDEKGYFSFKLPAHESAEAIDFYLSSENQERLIKNICFGDVFLLGGQSNMQLWLGRLKTRYSDEIKAAHHSTIRFFEVPQNPVFAEAKQELESGEWKYAVGEDLENLSAIGYFFAVQHYKKTKVPIGLIATAIGGTLINSWLSEQSLRQLGALPQNFAALKDKNYLKLTQELDDNYQTTYLKKMEETDKGIRENWQSIEFDASDWREANLNQSWEEKETYPGVVWLRKQIEIPDKLVGKKAEFRLGTFSDADDIFVNGVKVGSTEYKYPPRNYPLGKLAKSLVIAIRLKIFNFPGEIRADKAHLIVTENEILDLDCLGTWKIKRSSWLPERKAQYFVQYEPTGLFNGMIAPLKNLKFSAILWYQGESDCWQPENYGIRFCKLIQEWRNLFQQADLPFLFVQLPNCDTEKGARWAELRSEQKKALALNKTAMVVALDYGEDNDLHPLNKKAVADDLYEAYQRIAQFPNGYSSGPIAVNAKCIDQELKISFQTFCKRLISTDSGYFEIIEGGQTAKMKDYKLVGNTIKIRLPSAFALSSESRVRYNWNNTPKPFIRNENGKAAAPFELKIFF